MLVEAVVIEIVKVFVDAVRMHVESMSRYRQ
jgi:hypothetical protein